MKANGFYVLTSRDKKGNPFHQKIFVASLIMVLIFASLPATSVFAAPAGDPIKNLELAWSNKLARLQGEVSFFSSFQLKPEKIKNASDQAKAQTYLAKYRSALFKAQTIKANHDGFDKNGKVTNENHARKTVRALAEQLQILRGMRTKLGRL